MSDILEVYIGRENEEALQLKYRRRGESDFRIVEDTSVTRAVFRFGPYCLDTETDVDGLISLEENATMVILKPGLIAGLAAGEYTGRLIIFDGARVDHGLKWGPKYVVRVVSWGLCPVEEEET